MSLHPSLTVSEKDKQARSVLKRTERIRQMQEKGKWKEGDSVYNLPKIKTFRIKIKKEKAEKVETATPVGGVAGPAAGAAPGAKETAKSAPKAQDKK